jgi:hypothetical protein
MCDIKSIDMKVVFAIPWNPSNNGVSVLLGSDQTKPAPELLYIRTIRGAAGAAVDGTYYAATRRAVVTVGQTIYDAVCNMLPGDLGTVTINCQGSHVYAFTPLK